jgi:uncharacterized membrane protein
VLSFFTTVLILGWILGLILWLVLICVWLLCIFKAYQGLRYKLTVLGDFVENGAR